MHTIQLTDEELRILYSALHAYLDDFGHDEVDVLRQAKAWRSCRVRPRASRCRRGS